MDKIEIKKLQFYGNHGVLPEEKVLGQLYIVDLDLMLPLNKAGYSDNLNETVNYADVCKQVQDIVENETYSIIETLAERIAAELLQTNTAICEITVRVHKPHPPVQVHFDGVSVEIKRKRMP